MALLRPGRAGDNGQQPLLPQTARRPVPDLQAMPPAASQAGPVTTVAAEELKGMSDFSANIRRGAALLKQRLMPIRRAESESGPTMSTEQLIEGLAADLRPTGVTPRIALRFALAVSVMIVVALSTVTLGPRADFWATITTSRFLFEIAVTGTLAVSAFLSLQISAYPDATWQAPWRALLPATLLLLSAVILELFSVRSEDWIERTMGQNSALCVTVIVLMGLPPLVAFIAALRRGAPIRPGSAGMLAGVLSGAIAATFYAIQSPEDSLLFFAAWSSLAIGLLAVIGAIAGRWLLNW